MGTYYRPTKAEISLNALQNNIEGFRARLNNGTKIMASVKANAYGHGAIEIAKAAVRFGVDYLGVAFLDEALQLRNAGIQTPILVLGYVAPEHMELASENQVTISFFTEEQIVAASRLKASLEQPLKVHVKLDTGMGRLGLTTFEAAVSFIERALNIPQLQVEGVFTHYSKADEEDKQYTEMQYLRFHRVEEYIRKQGWNIPLIHAANSAAGIDTPQWSGDMVRLGIAMYGLYPDEVDKKHVKLQPVMSLSTSIVHIKQVEKEWGISYGARYTAKAGEWIGTLPIGYADGFSRMLSGKAEVLIRGKRVPVIGSICMDQCMVSLEAFKDEVISMEELLHEKVVIIGKQGEESITADEIANKLGTIHYEFICMIANRVPREYVENNKKIALSNHLIK